MSRELGRLDIGIAALSETCLPEEDELIDEGSGYSGLTDNLKRTSGITDRIMKLWGLLPYGEFFSILSVYASTLQANEEVGLAFYRALHETITKIPGE